MGGRSGVRYEWYGVISIHYKMNGGMDECRRKENIQHDVLFAEENGRAGGAPKCNVQCGCAKGKDGMGMRQMEEREERKEKGEREGRERVVF